MSLITDPWDDDDVQVEELDSRFKKIRTVQHRTHSAWNDTSTQNRPALSQVEIKPTVRIMRRDTNSENNMKKSDSPEIAKQTFAQKEQAYAEARKRILGITDDPPKQPPVRNESSSRGRPRGGGNTNRGRNNRDNRNNRNDDRDDRNNRNQRNDRNHDQNNHADDPPKGFAPRGGGTNRGRGRSNGYRGRGRGRQSHDRET